MTIIIVPTERCNARCSYCFEPNEVHEGLDVPYSYEKIKHSLDEIWNGRYHHSGVCLHGGECTLIPVDEFEKLVKMIHELPWRRDDGSVGKKGAVSMVTNGTLITDKHIEIFKKYNVHVSISVDGSPELNVHRGQNPLDEAITQEYNKRLNETIKKLRVAGVSVSIMCMMHNDNVATKPQRRKLLTWILWLKEQGITGGRLNPIYSDRHPELQPTNMQVAQMWVNVYHLNKKHNLQWNPVIEMENNLLGKTASPQPCVFNMCDTFNTHTISVLPDGQIGNCDRTFGRGLYTRSKDGSDSGRYDGLKQTECKDCPYWNVCHGGCPEEGVGGDWRRKTRFCEAIYKTYEYIEKQLRSEGKVVARKNEPPKTIPHGDTGHGDSPHGDQHGDAPHGDSTHGDILHGDTPHGDSDHGDTIDYR